MPGRKTENVHPTGSSNLVELWLRRIFIEDLGLKLLALAITLGLWFVVAGQRTRVERQFRGVQLDFRLPPATDISNSPPAEIAIVVSGSKDDLDEVHANSLVATVDVSDRKPGQRVVELKPERVRIDLPRGVVLKGFEPNTVSLNLEPDVKRAIEVEPRVDGKPAEGFEVKSVVATPAKVMIRGPASRVAAMQKAPTETIAVQGRRDSFEALKTAIFISDPKVEALESVNVRVEISPRSSSPPKP